MITACWCFLEGLPGTTNLEACEPLMQAVMRLRMAVRLLQSVLLLQFTLAWIACG